MYKTWHATKTKLNKLYFYSTEIRDKTFIETDTIIEYFSDFNEGFYIYHAIWRKITN